MNSRGSLLALAAAAATGGRWAELPGVLSTIASGIAYAIYAEVTAELNRAADPGPRGLVTTGVALTGAGALLAPVALSSTWPTPTPQSLATLLYLGLAATVLAYALFSDGLRVLPADRALSLLAVQPVAALAGDLLLHRSGGLMVSPLPAMLVAASLTLRWAPWPLIPLRRRGAGNVPRDGSCIHCP